MKKLIIFGILCLTLSTCVSAQQNYISGSISLSNQQGNDFNESAYVSIQAGFLAKNFAYGIAVGRGNLAKVESNESEMYWASLTCAPSVALNDKVEIYIPFALGTYFKEDGLFIEYGLGTSYKLKNNLNFFTQASNWDGTWYVSPGISYLF